MSIAYRNYRSSGGSNDGTSRSVPPSTRGEGGHNMRSRHTTAPSESFRGSQSPGCGCCDTRDTAPVCTDTMTSASKSCGGRPSFMNATNAHTCETTSTAKRLSPTHTRRTHGVETLQDTQGSDPPVTRIITGSSNFTIRPKVYSSLVDLFTLKLQLGSLTPEQEKAFSVRLNEILLPEGLQMVPKDVIDQSNDLADALEELHVLEGVKSRYEEQTTYTAALESEVETLKVQVKELDRLRKLAEDKLALVERSQAAR